MSMLEGDKAVRSAVLGVLGVLTIFLIIISVKGLMELRFVGSGIPAMNTISVEGTGEALAVPDTATINYSVQVERNTVAAAQNEATEIANRSIEYLESQGIEEKDIKTTAYNVYPQYDYITESCIPGVPCRGGRQELRGYQVSQSISVKLSDTAQVGTILGGLGELGVQNISGPNFEVDDIDAVRAEAREEAIAEAREKAKMLAKDLNVRLVRVVGFWEDNNPYYYAENRAYGLEGGYGGDMGVPSIPVGENEVMSRVNIMYEIR